MADDRLTEAIRSYTAICTELYREVRTRRGPPPQRQIVLWVPEQNSDFAAARVNWTQTTRTVPDWSSHSFLVYDHFRRHPQRQHLVEEIHNISSAPAAKIGFVLDNGAAFAGSHGAKKGINRAIPLVRKYIVGSIDEGPRLMRLRAELVGGFLRQRYKLEQNVWLRPVLPADLTYEVTSWAPEAPLGRQVPQSILEARVSVGLEVRQDEVTDWITALRLASGYPLLSPRRSSVPLEPILGMMDSVASTPLAMAEKGPEITAHQIQNAKDVRRLIQARQPIPSPVATALDRLGRSIEQPAMWPQGLLFSVMGLEALFLEGQPEARRTLSTRTALLLGLAGLDSVKVRDNVGIAYRLRSEYVHGADFDSEGARQITIMHREMRDYLRRAILTFLACESPKGELLGELDVASVDLRAAERLRTKLWEGIRRSHLTGIFRTRGNSRTWH